MSLVKSKAIQLGFDATPTNNFLIYQPLTPDGTFRIANGNQGATTDIMTVTSGGSVTFAGTTNFSSLNFAAGSESAPSLFPTGDSNTGIWFPAADTFAVSTGGTQRLRIASDGRITFGSVFLTTASSSAALDFSGVTSPSLNKSPSNSFAFTNNGGLNSSNPFWLGHHFASPVITVSGTNNFPRASHFYSYTSATDPTDLTYNIWLGNASVAQNFSLSAGSSSGYMSFSTSSTERMRIDNNGRVGIGTSGPLTGLDLRGTSATAAATLQIVGNNTSTLILGQNSEGGVIRGQGGNNILTFWTGGLSDTAASASGTERMRIDSNGEVQIGNTSAYGTLTIQRKANAPYATLTLGDITESTNTVGIYLRQSGASAAGISTAGAPLAFFTGSPGNNEVVRITADGKVGIGNNAPDTTLHVTGTTKSKSFMGRNTRTYYFDTTFGSGSGTRRYHIGRLFDNNQRSWGHFGVVKIRIYDSYYSSGGHREYTLTTYNNILGGNVSVTQTGGVPSGESLNYKVSLGPSVNTGLTYGSQPINYYNIYVDVQYYVQCHVEVEAHSNNAGSTSFEVTTPTTTGYGAGNYWQTEFYTDTYISSNYTDNAVTGSFKWANATPTILKQVAWTSFSDLFLIDLRSYTDHWKTVEVYLHYYSTSPTRCDHYYGLRDSGSSLMSVEWNCWAFKRNASASGGFVNIDSLSAAAAYGRYMAAVDSGDKIILKMTVDLTNSADTAYARPGIMWDANYTWGDIGSSRATGSGHPVGNTNIGYVEINLDASSGYSGTPAGYYMYTIVGIN